MQVEAVVNGFAVGTRDKSTFAVHMKSESGEIHERTIPLKDYTINQAELAAVQYVCAATKDKSADLIIKTSNNYLVNMLTKTGDKWKANPKNNADLVNNVRTLLGRFKSFSVVLDDSELMQTMKSRARGTGYTT